MATLTVRGLDEETRSRLRDELSPATEAYGHGSRMHARFAGIEAGDDLPLPPRDEAPRAAVFDE